MLRKAHNDIDPLSRRTRGQVALLLTSSALLVLMFPLIWLGGLVTSTGAGMSVPDWPNTYGYNMFAVPWDIWLGPDAGGVFFEHTHRLLASVVGMVAIAACVLARVSEPRRWVRWIAYAVLIAICVQGTLGGLRVVWVNLDLAVIHGIFGQLTFGLTGVLVLVQTRWWRRAVVTAPMNRPRPAVWASALVGLLVVQLGVAAIMRHYGAGLAVPDWPLHYGKLLPPVSEAGLRRANDIRTFDLHLSVVTYGEIWLHMTHRLLGYTLGVLTLVVGWKIWRTGRLRGHVAVLTLLMLTQVTLGVLTVLMNKPADIATLHQATGAAMLLVAILLAVRSCVVLRKQERPGSDDIGLDATSSAAPSASAEAGVESDVPALTLSH